MFWVRFVLVGLCVIILTALLIWVRLRFRPIKIRKYVNKFGDAVVVTVEDAYPTFQFSDAMFFLAGTEVERIEQAGGHYVVYCADGSIRHLHGHVVLTAIEPDLYYDAYDDAGDWLSEVERERHV